MAEKIGVFLRVFGFLVLIFILFHEDIEASSEQKWQSNIRLDFKTGTSRNIGQAAFFTPIDQDDHSLLFVDARFMRDTQPNMEGNFGLGYRTLTLVPRYIWGVYGFFDRRKSKFDNLFNQVTLGTELLSNTWDYRFNAYFPITKEKTIKPNDSITSSVTYRGYEELITQQKEVPLMGGDIEIGRTFPSFEDIGFYGALFHFRGKDVKNMNGARIRGVYKFNDYVSFNAELQYDNVRRVSKFVGISVTIPLGEVKERKNTPKLEKRMTDVIIRDLDIVAVPTDHIAPSGRKVLHLSDQGSQNGDGTVERPLPLKEQAPATILHHLNIGRYHVVVVRKNPSSMMTALEVKKALTTAANLTEDISSLRHAKKSRQEIERDLLQDKRDLGDTIGTLQREKDRLLGLQRAQEHEEEAAIKIQSTFRSYLVRRGLKRDLLAHLAREDAAIDIQRTVRGYLARKQAAQMKEGIRIEKETQEKAAETIQFAFRSYQARIVRQASAVVDREQLASEGQEEHGLEQQVLLLRPVEKARATKEPVAPYPYEAARRGLHHVEREQVDRVAGELHPYDAAHRALRPVEEHARATNSQDEERRRQAQIDQSTLRREQERLYLIQEEQAREQERLLQIRVYEEAKKLRRQEGMTRRELARPRPIETQHEDVEHLLQIAQGRREYEQKQQKEKENRERIKHLLTTYATRKHINMHLQQKSQKEKEAKERREVLSPVLRENSPRLLSREEEIGGTALREMAKVSKRGEFSINELEQAYAASAEELRRAERQVERMSERASEPRIKSYIVGPTINTINLNEAQLNLREARTRENFLRRKLEAQKEKLISGTEEKTKAVQRSPY